MTAPPRRPRRRSGNGDRSPTLTRLAAARAQLDAEIVERRRREDELLTEYAAATDAVTDVEARRDAALADLERQATQMREAADRELATLEARQGAVLVALHEDRTAEELATLVSLPLRRVRTLLRTHREPTAAETRSPTPPPDAPAPGPSAEHPATRPAATDSPPADDAAGGEVRVTSPETAPDADTAAPPPAGVPSSVA
jgi:hypothetical protein